MYIIIAVETIWWFQRAWNHPSYHTANL